MKNRKRIGLFAVGLSIACLLTGCSPKDIADSSMDTLVSKDETYEKSEQDQDESVRDSIEIYEDTADTEVKVMYLTVGYGNELEGTDHTWPEVNDYALDYYEKNELQPYKCEAVLQVGDEIGPLKDHYGYGQLTANATVSLKGKTASTRQQKSYRIELKEGKGKYEKMKTVILNKEFTDPHRFTEKLSFRLMQDIPELLSVRTEFVHLYVKDKTEGENGLFEDYGLYTLVEPVNKTYLKNHGLDNGGHLYEAEQFDWERHEDVIVPATDEAYDLEAFETLLSVKGDMDHSKLINMLTAVNDEQIPIEEVVEQYFEEENLFHWMAFQILTGNKESAKENYSLYSSRGSERFIFLSDSQGDGFKEEYEALRNPDYDPSWKKGIFPFVQTVLFKRILQSEDLTEHLEQIVDHMFREELTREKVEGYLESYQNLAEPILYSLPDRTFARVTESDYDRLVWTIYDQIEANYYSFYDSLQEPWPFHILEPKVEGEKLSLQWEESWCRKQEVKYEVQLSDTYDFSNLILDEEGISDTKLETDLLPEGQYFLRIHAVNEDEQKQDAYEFYNTEQKTTLHSVLCFYVFADGSVHASYFEEEN